MNKISDRDAKALGVFGGTFDPIHIGHLIVAEWIADFLKLEKVCFIPIHRHPFHKRRHITEGALRLQMIQKAIDPYVNFSVDDFEIKQQTISYTIDTLQYLKGQYPQHNLYFIIGDDNLENFSEWKEPERILEMCQLAVFRRSLIRPSMPFHTYRIINIDTPLVQISSSLIRERISQNKCVQTMLPANVYDFIRTHNLYTR
ncbi:MAG: nicotinate (nicotinamide) nucleotide adenylyltransferase [Caldithrix sp.]|nr:nicotinate (nicotinamide) nucleotide adenylyltransferase [Caldithrix sp.]